ncbi:MAG: (d)CMP kinase [Oscillospiraceae bacterium]|nr:(d)CMP kinase [Oscillospiraceae bacterium]
MNNTVAIAVDGPSGAGKSSLSKRCAQAFGFMYVDTGAIYRTVGLAALRRGIDRKDSEKISGLLPELSIELKYNEAGEQRMLLNGEDVSDEIRKPEVSICASDVSSLPVVRAFLMDMQRSLALRYNVIMDGRDIGTVVLPNADLKIFLTASAEARAQRRWKELQQKGIESDYLSVLTDIRYRDEQDSSRAAAPLRKAEDAVELDTTELDFEESFAAMSQLIIEKLCISPAVEEA